MASIVISEERYDDIIMELLPLLHEHWLEIANYKEDFVLNPDFKMYQELSDRKILRFITARKEGAIVGYMILVVTPHMHYKHKVVAKTDLLFVTKAERKGRTGLQLLKESEAIVKSWGVDFIITYSKVDNPIDKVLKHVGYTDFERVLIKKLGD